MACRGREEGRERKGGREERDGVWISVGRERGERERKREREERE
jgi:hypothetical protein